MVERRFGLCYTCQIGHDGFNAIDAAHAGHAFYLDGGGLHVDVFSLNEFLTIGLPAF